MTIEAIDPAVALDELTENGEDIKKMATGKHSRTSARLVGFLLPFVDQNKLGNVLDSSALYNFNDNMPRRQPDISFISLEKLPEIPDETLTVAPDLAAEVVSKNDIASEVLAKVKQYQQAGVRLVWIIYPSIKVVDVYRLKDGFKSQRLIETDALDGEDVIPGFSLPVGKLF